MLLPPMSQKALVGVSDKALGALNTGLPSVTLPPVAVKVGPAQVSAVPTVELAHEVTKGFTVMPAAVAVPEMLYAIPVPAVSAGVMVAVYDPTAALLN
jgi:hypothetical protein